MNRSAFPLRSMRFSATTLAGSLILGLLGFGAFFPGCAANDPFDPSTATNSRPIVRLFAAPLDPDTDLSPTSYNERTFYWSGSDKDGWITEFNVSIRTDRDVEAPWVATQRTDTTMTFVTDESGEAEATFYLVCKDNRGALSDTLVQLIPLKNFPPVINFEPDFNPLHNMQREISAENDTIFFNWGASNFRFFAFDLDGSSTMDDFVRYTLSDVEPEITRDHDDPLADPETEWVRLPFENPSDKVHHFELFFDDVAPADPRKLTLSLIDEAFADTRFEYDWIIRDPKGAPGSRVLFVQEGAGVPDVFQSALDLTYGVDGWDVYRFWGQFPDKPITLIENLRRFNLVIWGSSGGASSNMQDATAKDTAILDRYVNGDGVAGPNKLLMFSPKLTGYASTLDAAFLWDVLGIYADSSPKASLEIPTGKQALGLQAHLPDLTALYSYSGVGAIGLDPILGKAEGLYRMEYCVMCYSGRAQPYDPIVGVRRPLRSSGESAQVVSLGFTPENFFNPDDLLSDQMIPAIRAILELELEVVSQ